MSNPPFQLHQQSFNPKQLQPPPPKKKNNNNNNNKPEEERGGEMAMTLKKKQFFMFFPFVVSWTIFSFSYSYCVFTRRRRSNYGNKICFCIFEIQKVQNQGGLIKLTSLGFLLL